MKMDIVRDMSTGHVLLRFIPELVEHLTLDAFKDEMRFAIKHFVSTDPQCQVLIDEMIKEAFKGIDLLAVISEAINAKVKESLKSGSGS